MRGDDDAAVERSARGLLAVKVSLEEVLVRLGLEGWMAGVRGCQTIGASKRADEGRQSGSRAKQEEGRTCSDGGGAFLAATSAQEDMAKNEEVGGVWWSG